MVCYRVFKHRPMTIVLYRKIRLIMRPEYTQPHEASPTVRASAHRDHHRTLPSPALTRPNPAQHGTIPASISNVVRPHHSIPASPTAKSRTAKPRQRKTKMWLIISGLSLLTLMGTFVIALTLGVGMIYGSGILPNVKVAGINLGGMSEAEAISALQTQWTVVTLRDGERTWNVEMASLGLSLDAQATVQRAHEQGRGEGSPLAILLKGADISPVVDVDIQVFTSALNALTDRVDISAQNAGVQFVNGQVQAASAVNGRQLNIEATLAQVQNTDILTNGELTLIMNAIQPAVTDSSALVQEASQLLTRSLDIGIYDPMTGDIVTWVVQPQLWATWLSAESDANSTLGLRLSIADAPLRDYLANQSSVLDSTRYLDLDASIIAIRDALANNNTSPMLRVYHHDRQHVVQSGETITSIAWDYGVPYPWLQQANPNVNTLSVGQTITIPSLDNFLPNPVVPEKRIIVSISNQRVYVYEHGQMIQEWLASTGISNSPTWTGVYQIISHEPNAYAGNWNLWMPNFMGVYQPIPNSDFTNGFHGFPTRGGGQLLWENSLGTRVTYGCILLSDANVRWLYNWAQEGVVVEIQP